MNQSVWFFADSPVSIYNIALFLHFDIHVSKLLS